jgi:replicative DNA helicase
VSTATRTGPRLPPHNLDAEEALLGAVLLASSALAAAAETGLTADEFYRPAHGHIYVAALHLDRAGNPVDPVTVADELTRQGLHDMVGGVAQLITLQTNTPAMTNAGRYARIVRDMAQLRRLITAAAEISQEAYDLRDDVPAAIDRAEARVFAVGADNLKDTVIDVDTGVPVGFTDLDIVLASTAQVELTGLRNGNLTETGWARALIALDSRPLPLHIDDKRDNTITEPAPNPVASAPDSAILASLSRGWIGRALSPCGVRWR